MDAKEIIKELQEEGIKGIQLGLDCTSNGKFTDNARRLIKIHKQTLIDYFISKVGITKSVPKEPISQSSLSYIPPLPWQLNNLLRAASSKTLTVSIDGITNPSNYVLAYVSDYLLGSREHALSKLWEVYKAWQEQLQKGNK